MIVLDAWNTPGLHGDVEQWRWLYEHSAFSPAMLKPVSSFCHKKTEHTQTRKNPRPNQSPKWMNLRLRSKFSLGLSLCLALSINVSLSLSLLPLNTSVLLTLSQRVLPELHSVDLTQRSVARGLKCHLSSSQCNPRAAMLWNSTAHKSHLHFRRFRFIIINLCIIPRYSQTFSAKGHTISAHRRHTNLWLCSLHVKSTELKLIRKLLTQRKQKKQ